MRIFYSSAYSADRPSGITCNNIIKSVVFVIIRRESIMAHGCNDSHKTEITDPSNFKSSVLIVKES